MKRILFSAALLTALTSFAPSLRAQDAQAAAAARQEAEEHRKWATAKIQELEESNVSLHKKLTRLAEELRASQDEIARLKNGTKDVATRENIKLLDQKVDELERNRKADNERWLTAFNALKQEFLKLPTPGSRNPAPAPGPGSPGANSTNRVNSTAGQTKGYEYTIKDKDTLSGIVVRLRADGYMITSKQITNANPTVNWNRLIPGKTTIFIPQPTP